MDARVRWLRTELPTATTMLELPIYLAIMGAMAGSGSRRAELRTEEPHAPVLKLQSVLESLEARWQTRFLPSIDQRTSRFRNRLLA